MDPKRIAIIVAILAVVGLAVYQFVIKEQLQACSKFDTQDKCALPCKWDEYFKGEDGASGRCVEKETPLTELPAAAVTAAVAEEVAARTEQAPAAIDISSIEGLTGRYSAESYSMSQKLWKDETENANDVRVSGDLSVSDDKTYVYGGAGEKFTLPGELFDRQYTLFIVSKYNGENKRRILTSAGGGGSPGTTTQSRAWRITTTGSPRTSTITGMSGCFRRTKETCTEPMVGGSVAMVSMKASRSPSVSTSWLDKNPITPSLKFWCTTGNSRKKSTSRSKPLYWKNIPSARSVSCARDFSRRTRMAVTSTAPRSIAVPPRE